MRIIYFRRMVTFTASNAHICSREFLNNFSSTNQDFGLPQQYLDQLLDDHGFSTEPSWSKKAPAVVWRGALTSG